MGRVRAAALRPSHRRAGRRAPLLAQAAEVRAAAHPGGAGDRARRVRGAARAQQLQLPRRGELARGAAGGGDSPAPARPRPHRSRRALRRRPSGRGRRGVRAGEDGVRRRALPRAQPPAERRGRPGGQPPRRPRPPAGGVPPARRRDHRRAARGRREGAPGLPAARAGRAGRRRVDGADRLPQGRRAPGAGRAGRARSGARGGAPGGAVRPRQRAGRADRPGQPARHHRQRRARPDRRPARPARRGDQQRPLRLARAVPAGDRRVGRARPAQPGRDGRLAARVRRRAPAQRRRDGQTVRPLPRRGGADRGGRRRPLLPAAQRPPAAAQAGGPGGAHPDELAPRAHLARCGRALPRPRREPGEAGAHRARARRDRGQGLPRLLPDRARHRAVRPQPGHPVPGPRVGGELGGRLPARDHRGRLDQVRPAVRALPLQHARGGARHRRRLRLRPPRGGHPVRLQQVRPAQRGAGRQRDHLPAQERGARHGEGARPLHRPAGRLEQADRLVVARPDHRRPRHPGRGGGAGAAGAEVPAAPRHPLGRHGAHRPARRRGVPDRARPHGGAHGAAVGQGRLRVDGPGQVRPARARDAERARLLDARDRVGARRAVDAGDHPEGGAGRVRHALPRRLDRRVPGGEPGADRHAPPAAAPARSTTS